MRRSEAKYNKSSDITDIIRFHCHQCGVDFQPHEGGRCEVCCEWFCLCHLHRQADTGKYRCERCSEGESKLMPDTALAWLRLRSKIKKGRGSTQLRICNEYSPPYLLE
jgi:predicted ATP-dependent serine protease